VSQWNYASRIPVTYFSSIAASLSQIESAFVRAKDLFLLDSFSLSFILFLRIFISISLRRYAFRIKRAMSSNSRLSSFEVRAITITITERYSQIIVARVRVCICSRIATLARNFDFSS